jgi:hypothetical protein
MRSFEGDNSIKIAGSTDLLFPVTEYLTGYLENNFMMMVDRNRQATIRTFLRDSSMVDIYFYSIGICEVYHDQIREKSFTYKPRTWMKMEIISDISRGLEWTLDNQELLSMPDVQPIDGIRFCTIDGPGYYESAPTVMYLDNFAIDNGNLLSVPNISSGEEVLGKIYYNGEEIIIENPLVGLKQVDVFNLQGQKIGSHKFDSHYSELHRISVEGKESLLILVLYDDQKRRYSRKIVIGK